MHNPGSVLKNEIQKLPKDFKITDHLAGTPLNSNSGILTEILRLLAVLISSMQTRASGLNKSNIDQNKKYSKKTANK